ncbi:peptidase S24/S26A/S26B/S26C [Xylariaceae sp. FL0662B]|nr:peptidase S24/S26A/S26B/S26C [Xylariaceae sp. FL0662B]
MVPKPLARSRQELLNQLALIENAREFGKASTGSLIWSRVRSSLFAPIENAMFRMVRAGVRGLSHNKYEIKFTLGGSMMPTLNPAGSWLGKCLTLGPTLRPNSQLSRGMVVCSYDPLNHNGSVGKRLIGLPGDLVRTRDDCETPFSLVRVPPSHVWLEGDAGAGESTDSNLYGPVPAELLYMQITHILYPFKRAGVLPWWEYDISRKIVRDQTLLRKWKGHKFEFRPETEVAKLLAETKQKRTFRVAQATLRQLDGIQSIRRELRINSLLDQWIEGGRKIRSGMTVIHIPRIIFSDLEHKVQVDGIILALEMSRVKVYFDDETAASSRAPVTDINRPTEKKFGHGVKQKVSSHQSKPRK